MRVFKTKWFAHFTRKTGISDCTLSDAIREAENGLNDGELGGGLIKKRVARSGEGKRGGYRTIIIYRKGERSVFVYGFPKNAKAGLTPVELDVFRKLAGVYLELSDTDIKKALNRKIGTAPI